MYLQTLCWLPGERSLPIGLLVCLTFRVFSQNGLGPSGHYIELPFTVFCIGQYGRAINFWDWTTHKLIQKLDLGPSGYIPLEIRFLHNPEATEGYVGAALSSAIHHFYRNKVKLFSCISFVSFLTFPKYFGKHTNKNRTKSHQNCYLSTIKIPWFKK